MLFHMLFMPKYAERKASRMDKSLFGSDFQKINWRSQEVLNLDQSEPNFDFDFFRF